MKILVAEDEISIARGIESIIQSQAQQKHKFAFAENGLEALEIAKTFHPDLIITDIRMFRMTGLEFIEKLKEIHPTCKVIIVTGYSHFKYVQQALRLGVMDYLLKPIDKQRLLELVNQVWSDLPETYSRQKTSRAVFHDFFCLDFEHEDYPHSLKKVIRFIQKNYVLDISLHMLSEKLLLHPNYISTLINKHFKVSFNYVLDHVRLEKACELLSNTDKTIAEISYLVGYNNERRLYHAFRKRLNSSPGDFRKEWHSAV